MKKLLACLLILACNVATQANAQCVTLVEATLESTCVVMPRDGVRGVWFDLATADTLRRAHSLVPELQLQVDRWTSVARLRDAQIDDLRAAATLRAEALMIARSELEESLRREQRAREALNKPRRSPLLWAVIGAVVGGATVAALASAVR